MNIGDIIVTCGAQTRWSAVVSFIPNLEIILIKIEKYLTQRTSIDTLGVFPLIPNHHRTDIVTVITSK